MTAVRWIVVGNIVTVTKRRGQVDQGSERAARGGDAEARRCAWCARRIASRPKGPGRPRTYCRRSCRQRAYEARQRVDELGLGESELVMARAQLDLIRDRSYVLECAIEDVEGDVSASSTKAELVEALDWLLEAARPLVGSLAGGRLPGA